eukprot:2542603-Lingulodinium_polyedra.AAC.1
MVDARRGEVETAAGPAPNRGGDARGDDPPLGNRGLDARPKNVGGRRRGQTRPLLGELARATIGG